MARIIFYILTVLLSTMSLTACGISSHKAETSPKQTKDQAAEKSTEQARTEQRVSQLLKERDYVGAIRLIQEKRHNGSDEQVLAKEYILAANNSLRMAGDLTDQGHFSEAGTLLKAVQDSYPRSLNLQQQMTASPAQITQNINICTEELMEAGLVAYRSGEFAEAIDIWKQVLEFNPNYEAAKDSIQTTERQLTNLKALSKEE